MPRETESAKEFIQRQLVSAEDHSITITASGPLTNIADCIRDNPELMQQKIKRIIIMGGCTEDMPAHDMPMRRGNISPHAEFNFLAAPSDAKAVMESGLPITLLPMNCTHGLTLTPEREELVRKTYETRPQAARKIIQMMSAPKELDRKKFNSDPVMHDVNCALYLLYPEKYETTNGMVAVTPRDGRGPFESQGGHTDFTPTNVGNVTVATAIKQPDRLFDIFLGSMRKCVPSQHVSGRTK